MPDPCGDITLIMRMQSQTQENPIGCGEKCVIDPEDLGTDELNRKPDTVFWFEPEIKQFWRLMNSGGLDRP
jgi:hypothetical protein